MSGLKKWCVHPTRHMNDTRIGRRPSHPQGHHPISAQLARNMQAQYSRSIGMSKISLKEGDLLCKVCYYRERARFDKLYSSQAESMDIGDEEEKEQQDATNITSNIIEDEIEEENEEEDVDDEADESFYPPREQQETNKQILNKVFQLIGITPITDVLVYFILT